MSKDIAAQEAYQGTAIGSGTLASSLLVMKGLQDIEGSFDRLCLRAGLAGDLGTSAPDKPRAEKIVQQSLSAN